MIDTTEKKEIVEEVRDQEDMMKITKISVELVQKVVAATEMIQDMLLDIINNQVKIFLKKVFINVFEDH